MHNHVMQEEDKMNNTLCGPCRHISRNRNHGRCAKYGVSMGNVRYSIGGVVSRIEYYKCQDCIDGKEPPVRCNSPESIIFLKEGAEDAD